MSEGTVRKTLRVAIQGEEGCNSHMAALQTFVAENVLVLACATSGDVFRALQAKHVHYAVVPIENSLHGSVFEHYDLLLEYGARILGETQLRVRHDVMVLPGVVLADVKRVLSHPVALSQCRRWLLAHPAIEAVPFYDTAGSVKHVIAQRLRDTAGIAPVIAAARYGADTIAEHVEDHAENYTRFYTLCRAGEVTGETSADKISADKLSLALTLDHRPGTLIKALEILGRAGANLTKIESRPVQGRPWEYVFFIDLRFRDEALMDAALSELPGACESVLELGRYKAAQG